MVSSRPCREGKKGLPKEPLSLRGAAYRIRTYDALIRSQVLYPAEVTPRAVGYIATCAHGRQASGRKKLEKVRRCWSEGVMQSKKDPPRGGATGPSRSGGELGIRTPDRICILYSLSRRAPSASRSALQSVPKNNTPQSADSQLLTKPCKKILVYDDVLRVRGDRLPGEGADKLRRACAISRLRESNGGGQRPDDTLWGDPALS